MLFIAAAGRRMARCSTTRENCCQLDDRFATARKPFAIRHSPHGRLPLSPPPSLIRLISCVKDDRFASGILQNLLQRRVDIPWVSSLSTHAGRSAKRRGCVRCVRCALFGRTLHASDLAPCCRCVHSRSLPSSQLPQTCPLSQPTRQSCEHPRSLYSSPAILVADHETKPLPESCGASL